MSNRKVLFTSISLQADTKKTLQLYKVHMGVQSYDEVINRLIKKNQRRKQNAKTNKAKSG